MQKKPEISIITPVFNAAHTIQRTIDSITNQTTDQWQLILIDDKSTDDSLKIIEKAALNDDRIHILKNKRNLGPAHSRNEGIRLAKGRFITFLDADDCIEKEKLKMQIEFMKKNQFEFTYTDYWIHKPGFPTHRFYTPDKVSYRDILKSNPISCLTAVYDTSRIGKIYMPNILKRQDYGLWLILLKQHVNYAHRMDGCFATYYLQDNSVSSNKWKAAQFQWKIYREYENLNFVEACYYFTHYTLRGLKKYGRYFNPIKKR